MHTTDEASQKVVPSQGMIDTNILILRNWINPGELPDEIAISAMRAKPPVAGTAGSATSTRCRHRAPHTPPSPATDARSHPGITGNGGAQGTALTAAAGAPAEDEAARRRRVSIALGSRRRAHEWR